MNNNFKQIPKSKRENIELTDERRLINTKINAFKSFNKEFNYDITTRTGENILMVKCENVLYTIRKVPCFTTMGYVDDSRKFYLLLIQKGEVVLGNSISISFSTLFQKMSDLIYFEQLEADKENYQKPSKSAKISGKKISNRLCHL